MNEWCIKIGIVLVLHFNPWVEASAGGLLVPEGLSSPIAKYFGTCFKYVYEFNCKKKLNFINSTQIEGLSPSYIDLSFEGFGSIPWPSICVLSALSYFFPDFQLLELSITDETSLVEMCIWCIKIGIVLVLHSKIRKQL
jgi:hypothetical protein